MGCVKNDFVMVLFIVLGLILFYACVQGKVSRTRQKRLAELRRQHERAVDSKVRLTRGKRFDCPACGSVESCSRCQ